MRFALAFVLLSGCASVGVFQRPQTLGRGRWELAAEVSSQAQAGFDSLSLYPMFAIAGRMGVSDRVDVGLRAGPGGLESMGKIMLTGPTGTVVSLAPSLGGTFWVPSGLVLSTGQAALPVLIGVPFGDRFQLILAPRLHDSLFVLAAGSAGAVVNTFQAGGAIGLAVRVKRFSFIPDVGFLAPIATTTWRSDLPPGTVWGQGRWGFQANVTVTLEKAR